MAGGVIEAALSLVRFTLEKTISSSSGVWYAVYEGLMQRGGSGVRMTTSGERRNDREDGDDVNAHP